MILEWACTTYLLLLQIQYTTRYSVKEVRWNFNKIFEEYLRKNSFLVKFQILEMNSFPRISQGFCLKF